MLARSFAATLALMALPGLAQASTYLPWSAGDQATFTDAGSAMEAPVEITRSVRGNWHRYSNFFGLGNQWVNTEPQDEVIRFWDGGNIQTFMDMDAPVGTTVAVNMAPCNIGDVTLAARGLHVDTPGGSFDGVIQLDLQTNCQDAGVEQMFFAPGVGPVKWTTSSLLGPMSFELTSGEIGGTTYPQAWGVSVAGRFETDSPWIDRMPFIGPPPPPTTYKASIRVANDTAYPMTYRFNGGQRFDILVFNEAGDEVASWSRGRIFTREIAHIEIAAGEALEFTGEVELTTDTGDDLPPGKYTVRVELTSSGEAGTSHPEGVEPPLVEHPIFLVWAL